MGLHSLAVDGVEDQVLGSAVAADVLRAAARKKKALEEEEARAREGEEAGMVTPDQARAAPRGGVAPEPEAERSAEKKKSPEVPLPTRKPKNRQIGHLLPEANPKHPDRFVRMLDDEGKVRAVDKGDSLSVVRRAQQDEKTILAVLSEAKTRWPDQPLLLAGNSHFMQNAMRLAVDQGIAVEVPNATHRKRYEQMLAEKQPHPEKQPHVVNDKNPVQKMETGSVRPIIFPPPVRIEDAPDRQITGTVHVVSAAVDGRKTIQMTRVGKPLAFDVPDGLDVKVGQQVCIEKAKNGQIRAIDTRAKEKEIVK